MNKSPFPGMDPYLEESWRDVHHKLCTYACDDIQSQLSGGLFARLDERLVVELNPEEARSINPDVKVFERPHSPGAPSRRPPGIADEDSGGGVALAEPITFVVDEPATEAFIEILDPKSGGQVITVIEFVSPTNKLPGRGRAQYDAKREELADGQVNLVEINLLRAGPPLASFRAHQLRAELRTAYHIVVHRARPAPRLHVYPVPLDQRLPKIAIPLRPTDADIALDIQSLIYRAYRNGAYGAEIDYTRPPNPPLEPEAEAWADGLLREAGLR